MTGPADEPDGTERVSRARQVAALVGLQLRLSFTDWQPVGILIVMPLLLIAFIRPVYRAQLLAEGYRGADGAEQAVPGLAVLFSFMLVSYMGFEFFREHGLHTWDRLRACGLRGADLLVGKALPFAALALVQYGVLFGAGGLLFGMRVRGSVTALVLTCLLLCVCVLGLGLMLIAISRTYQRMNAVATLGAFVFAGVGGALAPLSTLPGWIQVVGRAVPTYWAMRAFDQVILRGGGVWSVRGELAALAGFAIAFAAVALGRFRLGDEKVL